MDTRRRPIFLLATVSIPFLLVACGSSASTSDRSPSSPSFDSTYPSAASLAERLAAAGVACTSGHSPEGDSVGFLGYRDVNATKVECQELHILAGRDEDAARQIGIAGQTAIADFACDGSRVNGPSWEILLLGANGSRVASVLGATQC